MDPYHLVITGEPATGFTFYGPYGTEELARRAAAATGAPHTFVAPLQNPLSAYPNDEIVHIAVWQNDQVTEAQAYRTLEAAQRDFGPASGTRIVTSTVQS